VSPKVVIVCFTFPPYNGIGGRRWAKFAKYLVEFGYTIEVVAAQKQGGELSPWAKDTLSYKTTFLKGLYPKILMGIPKNFIEKVWYRLSLILVKIFSKGNPYDHSLYFDYKLIPYLEKEIKKGVSHVIVSVAPFHMAYKIGALKQKFPNTTFIVDFRDPWTNNKTSFGYSNLSTQRMQVEQKKEKKVVEMYDKVVSVSDTMTEYFQTMAEKKDKCITVTNGFDIEDFISENKASKNEKLKLVFAGSLYDKALHNFEALINALKELEAKHPDIINQIEINIAGYMPQPYHGVANTCKNIIYHGQLSLDATYNLLSEADAAMLFLTDDLNYTFSTKFYEYIALSLPIIVCSKYGVTSEYIVSNQLGYAFTPENMKQSLLEVFEDWEKNKLVFNHNYSIEQHNIKNIIQNKLIPILHETP